MSLHDDAVALLQAHAGATAADPDQERLRTDYLAFLTAHPDGTWRSCRDGHLTASTLVLAHDRRQVLLTLHPKVGCWLQMGGHCEPADPTVRAAAEREAREESGIDGLTLLPHPVALDRHRVGCHGGSWHLDVQFVALAPEGAAHVRSEESLDLRWWPVDDLPELTDDALRRLVRAALRATDVAS